jgi:hypothetical protein
MAKAKPQKKPNPLQLGPKPTKRDFTAASKALNLLILRHLASLDKSNNFVEGQERDSALRVQAAGWHAGPSIGYWDKVYEDANGNSKMSKDALFRWMWRDNPHEVDIEQMLEAAEAGDFEETSYDPDAIVAFCSKKQLIHILMRIARGEVAEIIDARKELANPAPSAREVYRQHAMVWNWVRNVQFIGCLTYAGLSRPDADGIRRPFVLGWPKDDKMEQRPTPRYWNQDFDIDALGPFWRPAKTAPKRPSSDEEADDGDDREVILNSTGTRVKVAEHYVDSIDAAMVGDTPNAADSPKRMRQLIEENKRLAEFNAFSARQSE